MEASKHSGSFFIVYLFLPLGMVLEKAGKSRIFCRMGVFILALVIISFLRPGMTAVYIWPLSGVHFSVMHVIHIIRLQYDERDREKRPAHTGIILLRQLSASLGVFITGQD